MAAQFSKAADAAERTLASADKLAALLANGRNIPWSAAANRWANIRRLAALREQATAWALRIGKVSQVPSIEDKEWGSLAAAAGSLVEFLDRWGRPLGAAVIRGLSDSAGRAALRAAVTRSDDVRKAGFDESWAFVTTMFDPAADVSTGIVIGLRPAPGGGRVVCRPRRDVGRLHEWVQFVEIERAVRNAGVEASLAEVLRGDVQMAEAADAFRARFLARWLDDLYERVSPLRRFAVDTHERLIQKFKDLDRRSIDVTPERTRHQLRLNFTFATVPRDAPESSEMGTLLREANKKRRHLPLRKLFAAMPTLLPRLKPCLMMSPLAVSTYLQSPDLQFDLVIFDEASQVRPHDSIGAIYRGRQLVIAGDQKQLPPTSFFERSVDDAEADEGDDQDLLGDYESVLDKCCSLGLTRRRLRWHYRSRRECLIAFANRFTYENDLVTFPSPTDTQGSRAVEFIYVADGRWATGGGVNVVEARRVAEFVIDHARRQPGKSLGVIAFSQRQQMRILEELEALRQAEPELEEFFREGGHEPFFVKNLENVQGDERDAIVLSIGYGPDENGKVAMRFGPLNRQGGERRLNVAVTRAREAMAVISSLRATDLDLNRTGAKGVGLLRAYLDYAENGPEALRSAISQVGEHDFDSPFEREVAEELERHGLTVHRQIGCSGYRIDLAVVDPKSPGRYLLGVECDGASYHAPATARDRDRLRQEVLEGLGWRLCRIWSTDWLRDRDRQVERVKEALARSTAAAIKADPPSRAQAKATAAARTATPVTVHAASSALPEYADIDAVPRLRLLTLIQETLRSYGATHPDDLVRAVGRQLGFKRTGTRIKERIDAAIAHLLKTGMVLQLKDDDRLKLAQPRGSATA